MKFSALFTTFSALFILILGPLYAILGPVYDILGPLYDIFGLLIPLSMLAGADTVVFYDSDWNPAMDRQASNPKS